MGEEEAKYLALLRECPICGSVAVFVGAAALL